MLDVGFSEILLTSAIALIVLGPERLPKVARQVGNWMGRARAMARQLSEQLEREVTAEELLKSQSKVPPATEAPYKPSMAPPSVPPSVTPSVPPATAASSVTPSSMADSHGAPPLAPTHEVGVPDSAGGQQHIQGLDASATTAAAMHAADAPAADPKPPHE